MEKRPLPRTSKVARVRRTGALAVAALGTFACSTARHPAAEDPRGLAVDPACVRAGLSACEAACGEGERGDGRACTRAGMARLTAEDPTPAVTWLERGCALEDPAACNALADLINLGILGAPEPATELYERACSLGAKPACRTLEAKGQVWFSLPLELVFDEVEAPDPKVEMPMGPEETLRVVVAVCVREGRKPVVLVRSPSAVGGLDDAVVDTMSGWRFSLSPRVRPDAVLCRSWAFNFRRAPESPHDEWRSRQAQGAGSR